MWKNSYVTRQGIQVGEPDIQTAWDAKEGTQCHQAAQVSSTQTT